MKTLQEIRDELKMIREYHFALSLAGNGAEILVSNDIKRLMESYSRMVKDAPNPVQRAYQGLYEIGCTQKELAAEWGVTEKYVQILNKRLLLYLQRRLEGVASVKI